MAALGVIGFLGILVCLVVTIVSAIKKTGKVKMWGIGIAVSFIVFLVGAINSPSDTDNTSASNNDVTTTTKSDITQSTTAATTEPTTEAVPWIKQGMYKVGSDLPAGEYVIFSDGGMSYFQVSKDSSGSLEGIVTNDNFTGTRYVTVNDGQYIEFSGSKMLSIDDAPILEAVDNKYQEGMYKVGRDIKAGEYKIVPDGTGNSYMEVAKDSSGILDSIVTNDNLSGEKYITIADGQYIKLSGCHLVVN